MASKTTMRVPGLAVFCAMAALTVLFVGCDSGSSVTTTTPSAEPATFSTNSTGLSACSALTANTSYSLMQDISAATPDGICITLATGVTLDTAGHKITGKVYMTGGNPNGITVFASTPKVGDYDIECSDSTGYGCLKITADQTLPFTAPLNVHHLKVHNSYVASTGGVRTVYVAWEISANPTGAVTTHLYNNTVAVDTCSSVPLCNRSIGLQVQMGNVTYGNHGRAEINNNALSCPTDANACNPIQLIGGTNNLVHDNTITLAPLSPALDPAGSRGITVDCADATQLSTAGTGSIYLNDVTANNNRAIRVRCSLYSVYSNTLRSCNSASYGCIHLMDSGSATSSDTGDYTGLNVYNNTFTGPSSGNLVWMRNGQNATVHDNLTTGLTGTPNFGYMTASDAGCNGGGTACVTSAAWKNNPTTASPNLVLVPLGTGTTNAAVCNTGTTSGATVVPISPCP